MSADAPLAVLDTCVAVKWFVSDGEDAVQEAAGLLTSHAEGQLRLLAPTLLAHEVMNVLRRRRREIPDLPSAMADFIDADVTLISPDRELLVSAARLTDSCSISTADASFAALALLLDCELVTADRRLATALEGVCRVRLI